MQQLTVSGDQVVRYSPSFWQCQTSLSIHASISFEAGDRWFGIPLGVVWSVHCQKGCGAWSVYGDLSFNFVLKYGETSRIWQKGSERARLHFQVAGRRHAPCPREFPKLRSILHTRQQNGRPPAVLAGILGAVWVSHSESV